MLLSEDSAEVKSAPVDWSCKLRREDLRYDKVSPLLDTIKSAHFCPLWGTIKSAHFGVLLSLPTLGVLSGLPTLGYNTVCPLWSTIKSAHFGVLSSLPTLGYC